MAANSKLAPKARYAADLGRAGFVSDSAQARAVDALQAVYDALLASPPKRGRGLFGRIHGAHSRWPAVQGLYLWGGVGRGKTYLMDAFFEALPFAEKRRTHFHRFMLDVHARRNRHPGASDPLLLVASEIAAESRVLCFDEFFVSDIADAMILGRLFEALFARGVVLVATSNVVPDLLYKDGLQRQNFLPAIAALKRNVEVLNVDSGTDYRLRALHHVPLYLWPDNEENRRTLAERFASLDDQAAPADPKLLLNDRPLSALRLASNAAWFDFDELCERPRAAADYIELARRYRAIIVSGVPQLNTDHENAARRWITLVDEFYDRGVKLIVGAAVDLPELYAGSRLKFEFERTRSRLIEMQSEEYLNREHRA